MSPKIEFTAITAHKPGTIASLLARSYEEFLCAGRLGAIFPSSKWPAFDSLIYDNPDTLGRSVFISCVEGEAVGFASWDARWVRLFGVVGHNCVVPEHRGRSYGKIQILEVLRRFREMDVPRAVVITGDDPFFVPAQRMYLACGFREVSRMPCRPDFTYGTIKYELDLTVPAGEGVHQPEGDALVRLP